MRRLVAMRPLLPLALLCACSAPNVPDADGAMRKVPFVAACVAAIEREMPGIDPDTYAPLMSVHPPPDAHGNERLLELRLGFVKDGVDRSAHCVIEDGAVVVREFMRRVPRSPDA